MYIAHIDELDSGLNERVIEGHKFFIYKDGNDIKIYDSVCPHQGATLHCDNKDLVYCKVHNWRFDAKSGESHNIQNANLFTHKANIDKSGNIHIDNYALNAKQQTTTPPPPQTNKLANITINMHAHACLEFIYNNFSLVCDPWIDGYAFFGAWRHYPKPLVKAKDIKPNAIWISHEHSDHFHAQTLLSFDKKIPIYIPAFANARLEKRLEDLGFLHIYSIPFGKRTKINDDFYITIYEPASLWNDAQALFEIGGFRILNINDAGINHRIHREIKSLDCICAAFSPGASGYPATYTHLDREQKVDIYEKSRIATLDMLVEVCRLYKARYFIPFASHFILNHPKHIEYMKIVRKNTIYNVLERFNKEDTEVIAMLAGDSFNVGDNKLIQHERNKNLYHTDVIIQHIEDDFDEKQFLEYYPNKNEYVFDKKVALDYFVNLNKIPEMTFCEDLSVSVYPDSKLDLAFSFIVEKGWLQIQDEVIESPNLTMKIPSEILMYICKNNESWDEATIGYWCEFSRNPDIYHTEFWRILQTPYYVKKPIYSLKNTCNMINESSNIAEVLETLGEISEKIFARYGLYCLTCNKAAMENIEQACLAHGIDTLRMQRMIKELNIHAAM